MPLDGTFVCANIYKLYLLHSHVRNSLINYKLYSNNYYYHYDLQEIMNFILIYFIYIAPHP